jgi:hypothetical protein
MEPRAHEQERRSRFAMPFDLQPILPTPTPSVNENNNYFRVDTANIPVDTQWFYARFMWTQLPVR